MTKEQLFTEVDDLLRSMPSRESIRNETQENLAWFGRLSAVIQEWNFGQGMLLNLAVDQLHRMNVIDFRDGYRKVMILLHQAQHDLRMQTTGPLSLGIAKGSVFEYFDEVRKTLEGAKQDVFFVDPYLDAEFVSRYLAHISLGVTIRLLAREKLPTLLPAVDAFAKQHNVTIQVRSAPHFHDRYVFIDRVVCYQSGASFKDGAKSAPTTLTQITDAFGVVYQTYETLWNGAKVER